MIIENRSTGREELGGGEWLANKCAPEGLRRREPDRLMAIVSVGD